MLKDEQDEQDEQDVQDVQDEQDEQAKQEHGSTPALCKPKQVYCKHKN